MKNDSMFLDDRMLACFCAAARTLHFGRAAASLHMSQPPFSQQIKRLEELIGAPLFERTTRSVRLTPAGAVMAEHAAELAARTAAMLRATRRAAHGDSGPLKVGLAPTAAYSALADSLYRYRCDHPEVELDLHEANSVEMTALLRSHHIDLAFMRPMPPETGIDTVEISREPMMLAVRSDHPWARRGHIRLQEAASLPLIGYSQQASPYFRQLLIEMFAAIGQRPRIVRESMIPTLLTLVEIGAGAAIVPRSLSRMRGEPLTFLPLGGGLPARLVAASLAGSNHAAAQGLLAELRSRMAQAA
ncbi:LysR substrate-binding domain-containing protein [Bordetella trematum]|uniref:LysR substrate-binding domain-containing protein n=1 Tax=Bordetella trematum TaxID=123899 RepID=UPI000D920F58|nr:LysR substrate-binding domain-containing protein [Bordetella trematum]SPU50844.1 LysR family transcriptional regulator [Bordetella trematum]VDH07091.1 Hca operon transcriptional activator [Bordetella trematum]